MFLYRATRSQQSSAKYQPSLCVGVTVELREQDKWYIVRMHNEARKQEGGKNIKELKWNEELAADAQAWANGCLYEHNSARELEFYNGSWMERNENLYANSGGSRDSPPSLDASMRGWYHDEKPYYDHTTNTCQAGKMCGHYMQVVFWETEEIGCGLSWCDVMRENDGTTYSNAWLYVCVYRPRAYSGEDLYQVGTACSQCPSHQGFDQCTELGLCTDEVVCGTDGDLAASVRCVQDLWRQQGCLQTGSYYPATNSENRWTSLTVSEARTDMFNLHQRAFSSFVEKIRSYKKYRTRCFGKSVSDLLPNCQSLDSVGPHSTECLQEAWFTAGCNQLGTLYPEDEDTNEGKWKTMSVRNILRDMYHIRINEPDKCRSD